MGASPMLITARLHMSRIVQCRLAEGNLGATPPYPITPLLGGTFDRHPHRSSLLTSYFKQ